MAADPATFKSVVLFILVQAPSEPVKGSKPPEKEIRERDAFVPF